MEEKNREDMERQVSSQAMESAQLLEELRGLRARELEWVFREDLDKIRRAFPQQAPDSIPELGDVFLKMRSLGIDPVTAFAAIRQAQRPETPPPMGPADGRSDLEGEFFGPEEVRRMTPQQVEANLKKIARSQRHW